MNVSSQTLDCRGMQCPAPILHLAKAARSIGGQQAVVEVLVDDEDFPKDLRAWCRASKAELLEMNDNEGLITARVGLNGAKAAGDVSPSSIPPSTAPLSRAPAAPRRAPAKSVQAQPASAATSTAKKLDCRGLRCPAPILQIAKAARQLQNGTLVVFADDQDFPADLKAWCRTSKAQLTSLKDDGGVIRAVLQLGAEKSAAAQPVTAQPMAAQPMAAQPVTAQPVAAQPVTAQPVTAQPVAAPPIAQVTAPMPAPAPMSATAGTLFDLRGLRSPQPVLQLSQLLMQSPGARVSILSDDPTFMTDAMTWCAATRANVMSAQQQPDASMLLDILLPGTQPGLAMTPLQPAVPAAAPAQSLAPVLAQQATLAASPEPEFAPTENRCTILVIKNDFESLMAAMMCATTSAAQGMEVVMFYSFWGVNVLRGDKKRKIPQERRVSVMQKMMQWMMPKGPKRQKMSQMHMAGMGKGMMQYFMGKNNVMRLEEMMETAVEQNVRFIVCSMSMGIMGIQKRDIVDLPNVEFAGVASFVEMSARSRMSLVF